MTEEPPNLYGEPHAVRTLVFNPAEQHELAYLDAAIWPPVGSVIDVGPPDRHFVVVGVRLAIVTPESGMEASIVVDVNEGGPSTQ